MWKNTGLLQIAFAVMVALAAIACDGGGEPRACTLIGCSSGLQVELESPPVAPFSIEAETSGSGGRYVVECADAGACRSVLLQDFTPAQVRIRIVSADGATAWLAEPVYRENRPNGAGCPPVCRVATVVVPGSIAR